MTLLDTNKAAQQTDELRIFINELDADKYLALHEIAVQKSWLKGLARMGFFTQNEYEAVNSAFDEAIKLLHEGRFPWDVRDEDIHMHLERFVTDRHGDLGKKMHIGRSRNDLVATTLRLYVRDLCIKFHNELVTLIRVLTDKAEATLPIIVPGTTHLQHGQPVYFAHILLAHTEAFQRDCVCLNESAAAAMHTMPLGAGAMSGTPLEIDLKVIADDLGFANTCRNSYDAVGDRDFILSCLDALAKVALHLSRLSEDVVYWASSPVGLVKLPAVWSTGSSIMPNKRNPEIAELTRGRSAHIISAKLNAYMLMRTTPTSYSGEMQEIKAPLLRAQKDLSACFSVWPGFIKDLQIDEARAKALLQQGHILATEITDNFALQGMPFRESYLKVKDLVTQADQKGVQVHELQTSDAGTSNITPESAVEKRQQPGGTAKSRVLEAIERNRRIMPIKQKH